MVITEDYVSFETAKLLKDKHFNGQYHMYYVEDGKYICDNLHDIKDYAKSIVEFDYLHITKVPAPTLQMAMRWLREIHHLFIEVQFGCYKGESWYSIDIIPTNDRYLTPNDNFSIEYPTYEEACEAAIKYCLENLI